MEKMAPQNHYKGDVNQYSHCVRSILENIPLIEAFENLRKSCHRLLLTMRVAISLVVISDGIDKLSAARRMSHDFLNSALLPFPATEIEKIICEQWDICL